MVVAPGAYDAITAVLTERAGFSAVYMTGAGTAASYGYPDFGLLSMTEMVQNAGKIADAVDAPVIADADTGYGNELNVFRTVREFERCGVAAIHLEDQEFPKRCGHLDDKRVIARDDYFARIRAAVAARRTADFLIIARTDARAVAGWDEAIERANGALRAGADMAFVEAPQSVDEVREIPRRVNGPCMLNVVRGGKTPPVDLRFAEQAGYCLAILPGLLLANVLTVCEQTLSALAQSGGYPEPLADRSVKDTFRLFGADDWDARRTLFHTPAGGSGA
jgi:2-methylisocitrate lyase-like PEP mutase family enzyme